MTSTASSTPRSSAPIALITGGSRGLGRNAALHLVHKGIDVIVTYRSRQDEAQAVVQQIEAQGGSAAALQLDVSQTASFPAFVESLKTLLARHWQREHIDHLVNNGGIGLHQSVAQTTEAQFDELMSVHLKGPFFLTQALLPMIQDGGSILNISSGLTRFAVPGYGAYASMKGAVEVLSRYLAKELGSRGIRVNTLAPGAIETDFNGGALRSNPELNRFVAGVTALGRAGLPDDIGPVVASLLSEDSHWITGQRVEASGGMFL